MRGGEAQSRRRTHPHRNPVIMRAGPAHHALDHHGRRVAQQRRGNQLYPLAAPPLIDERAYRTHTYPAQGVFAEVAEQTGSGLDPGASKSESWMRTSISVSLNGSPLTINRIPSSKPQGW